jgi:acetyl-CoA C-acetyltransferase
LPHCSNYFRICSIFHRYGIVNGLNNTYKRENEDQTAHSEGFLCRRLTSSMRRNFVTNIVIVSAARTAVGSFGGAFANTPADALGTSVLKAIVERAGIDPSEVSETILGQVLTAGQGQNPARQAHINAGLPIESAAWSINQVCGSGLRAVALAAQHIQLGDADIVAAGGQENMTLSPHVAHLRSGTKMGDVKYIDSMIRDGLWDAFNNYHMGQTAENVAAQWQISRDAQDEFAVASQNKAEAAQKSGKFADEITPFTVSTRKGDIIVEADEYIRHGATLEAMQKMRPAFLRDGGTVTAANASGLNDGAAAVLLMTADEAEKRGLEPLARIASYATAGLDPTVMGVGPIYASRKALDKAGWSVGDLDLVEANEAFAAQACAVNKDMGWDPAIVNVNGGAIAIGHPIGASGCRILNTLLFEMQRRQAKRGLATLCIGGGMGVAMCLERP